MRLRTVVVAVESASLRMLREPDRLQAARRRTGDLALRHNVALAGTAENH